jgi:hypothetical protein
MSPRVHFAFFTFLMAALGALLGNVAKYGLGSGNLTLGPPEIGTIIGVWLATALRDRWS